MVIRFFIKFIKLFTLFCLILITIIYLGWYSLCAYSRQHLSKTASYAIKSPNQQWVLEAYPYGPEGSRGMGVFRIYQISPRKMEIEMQVSDDTMWGDPAPVWMSNNELFYSDVSLQSVDVPANLWMKLVTWLP